MKRHASIRRPAWPAEYHRLIPAMPRDDAGGTARARDGGHEGGRSQDSVTAIHGTDKMLISTIDLIAPKIAVHRTQSGSLKTFKSP